MSINLHRAKRWHLYKYYKKDTTGKKNPGNKKELLDNIQKWQNVRNNHHFPHRNRTIEEWKLKLGIYFRMLEKPWQKWGKNMERKKYSKNNSQVSTLN